MIAPRFATAAAYLEFMYNPASFYASGDHHENSRVQIFYRADENT